MILAEKELNNLAKYADKEKIKRLNELLESRKPSEIISPYISMGGWPENITFSVSEVSQSAEMINFKCYLFFDEYLYGCDGWGRSETRLGEFTACIDLREHAIIFKTKN